MDNKSFQNLYEVRKTVRFGLTQPNKKTEWKINSHFEFNDLVQESFNELEKEINSRDKSSFNTEKELIEKINEFVKSLEEQLLKWKNIYERYDLISLNKDYYKNLARKAKFDAIWKTERYDKKQRRKVKVNNPQASQIKLSSLSKDNRKEKIISYWWGIISRNDYLLSVFKPKLEQYKKAVKESKKSNTKPDLIDFRKTFLSILNVSNEWLNPIFNKSIQIETWKKENTDEIIKIKEFSWDKNNTDINKLLKLWQDIKDYFESNWSQVPYWKVSLNYHTAVQKPNNFESEIDESIKNLWICNFIKKSDNEINEFLKQNSKEKIELLNNSSYGVKNL